MWQETRAKYTDAEAIAAILADDKYLKKDGSEVLTSDWNIGNGMKILADEIRARDGDGLALYDDGGTGIFVKDGGFVGVNIANPTSELHVNTTRNTPALRVQSTHADPVNRWAGVEYLKLDGSAGVFTGLNGNTNEFRFNNVATGGYIDFMIGSNSKLKIINSGYVGVGTTTPSALLDVNGDVIIRGDVNELEKLIFKDPTELTISGGSITVTQSRHSIDTQNDDATDDLAMIVGGEDGQILILNTENSARDVTLKHGTGNILISGGDYVMDSAYNIVMLIYTGTYWMKLM